MPDLMLQYKEERNARVQRRYDELRHLGKHGHYETLFQIVREEVDLATAELDRLRRELAEARATVQRLEQDALEAETLLRDIRGDPGCRLWYADIDALLIPAALAKEPHSDV